MKAQEIGGLGGIALFATRRGEDAPLARIVAAVERCVWEQGGPTQTFVIEVLEQLRARPARSAILGR